MTLTDKQLSAIGAENKWLREQARAHDYELSKYMHLRNAILLMPGRVDEILAHIREQAAEIERLRSHITAARSFHVLNENEQADRHLSEAMETNND